jgi:hypothetical protein
MRRVTTAKAVKTMTLASTTRALFGVAMNVDEMRPLEYSLDTAITPRTEKASRPKSQPDWITPTGSVMERWPPFLLVEP